MTPKHNQFLQAALRYADLGYPVFPCAAGAKNPLTEHGFLDATTDPERIERWWTSHLDANVAAATQGLLIIDVDVDEENPVNPWLADQPERMLELAAGPTAFSPRGGTHHWFRQPAGKSWRCTESALARKVDTRADGGYIVLPPSVGTDGKCYRWAPDLELDVAPARLPEPPTWLAEELDRLGATKSASDHAADAVTGSNNIPVGQRNATLARLAGTMRRVGMSQAEIAAALLQVNRDRCVPPLPQDEVERIAASIAGYEPDQVSVALAENHWAQLCAEQATDEVAGHHDPGPIPEDLLHVPGFVDEVMAYTLATAPYPERTLAFCGALVLQAFLASRKVRDAADNRTNLYVLGLANSGAGKEYPRKVNQRILLEVGLTDCLGDTFASGEGIEDRLFLHPAVLFQTDEIDGLMTRINLGRDARYEGIMHVLLKMYTSANSLYPMRVRAGREPGVIDQPGLCIFGTAIPKHYYEALSPKMLTNGFFARMLILETGKRGRGQEASIADLPAAVLATARWWADYCPGEKRGNLSDWHPTPRTVEATPEASVLLGEFRQRADDEYSRAEDQVDAVGMALWARANEKARRLALIHACSAEHLDLRITPEATRWACAFVEHQTRRMLFMAAGNVSENEFDARCKKLLGTLRKWRDRHGDGWMPFWQISRRHPWSEREHEEVRTALLNQRLLEYQETSTGGRPSRLYRMAPTS
jgi:hypothetical protein